MNDRYEKWNKHFEAEIAKSAALPKGVVVGKVFGIGVADGYAYYEVVRVNKKTVRIKWREDITLDSYQYFAWGTGCSVPAHLVASLIGHEEIIAAYTNK